jgi:hypothetical protein
MLLIWATFLLRAELAWRETLGSRLDSDTPAAVRSARAVFDLYVPGSPRLDAASELIWSVAETQEGEGDAASALQTYRTLRSAWIAAAPLGGTGGWMDRVEPRIARLASVSVPEDPGEVSGTRAEREAAALAEMRAPRRPNGPWSLVTVLGFAAWVGGAVGMIGWGFGRDGRPRAGVLRWAGFLAMGYLAWIIGMVRA